MKEWKKAVVAHSTSIRDTIRAIDVGAIQIAFVVDDTGRLRGTVTDGDIRRGILRGVGIDEPASQIMNATPVTAPERIGRDTVLDLMRQKSVHQIPLVDANGQLVGVELMDELLTPSHADNWVVLMAGGLGTRMRPLTDDVPKPLLKIANKPLLEIIIENFVEQGFRRFFLAVNYKAEMVQQYFGDGSRWNSEIRYLCENDRMGTAGALSLLPQRPDRPLIVMNADLLTRLDFNHLLNFHREHDVKATMCVREYDFQVPYGVVRIDDYRVTAIDEKPVHKFFVNAGIYVLEPDALDLIPPSKFYDMPELFNAMIQRGWDSGVFPIREYWLDVGRPEDFQRANGDYPGSE